MIGWEGGESVLSEVFASLLFWRGRLGIRGFESFAVRRLWLLLCERGTFHAILFRPPTWYFRFYFVEYAQLLKHIGTREWNDLLVV